MLKQLQNICGTRHTKKDKKTSWWSVEIQKVVQQKKQCFQKWLKSKHRDDYLQYRLARKNVKFVIKEAKVNSWNKYGEHLTDVCKTNQREFFKSIKSMRVREESYNPITIIND